ncbi:iron-sulfur assembly protein 1 [Trichomonascus vanleenenianus]|uniref:Fe-binding Fe/S cluster assembly protein ISA1 n=1 Tax=Trichomonascus vanleenenianus TaxID=2268995 RepID=UPI003EC98E20
MSLVRASKRYLQTVRPTPVSVISPAVLGSLSSSTSSNGSSSAQPSWAKHSLPGFGGVQQQPQPKRASPFNLARRSMPSAQPFQNKSFASPTPTPFSPAQPSPVVKPVETKPVEQQPVAAKPKRKLRPRKAAITLTQTAVEHLRRLIDNPNPQMIRVGVKNRGCSGLTYHLEYVDKPAKFDEEVVQDGVKVLIDSKALFSIIGSEMDWVDDKLASRFVFHNPNSKGQCGCGESFMV